jgi:hypothetical protein
MAEIRSKREMAMTVRSKDNFFTYLLLPWYFTILLLWGFHGGAASEFLSQAVMIGVNAVVYGLIAFGVLKWLRPSGESHSR